MVTVWENIAKDKRNEPLDLRVYNLAALRLLKPNFEALEKRLKEVATGIKTTPKPINNASKKQYGCVKRAADY